MLLVSQSSRDLSLLLIVSTLSFVSCSCDGGGVPVTSKSDSVSVRSSCSDPRGVWHGEGDCDGDVFIVSGKMELIEKLDFNGVRAEIANIVSLFKFIMFIFKIGYSALTIFFI